MAYNREPLRDLRSNHIHELREWLIALLAEAVPEIEAKAIEAHEQLGIDPPTARVVLATELRDAVQVFWLTQLAEARYHKVPVAALTEAINAAAPMSVNTHIDDIRSYLKARTKSNETGSQTEWRASKLPQFPWLVNPLPQGDYS